MSNRSEAAKVKSTDRAGLQSKSKGRDISAGNLMDGDVNSEYEYLRLHKLKAEIRDNKQGGEAMRALGANFKHDSESEQVATHMLKYLNGLSDYSAEFAQISSVAGMTSRVDIARDLAKRYCDSHSTQIVLDRIMGGKPQGDRIMEDAFASTGLRAGQPASNGWTPKQFAAALRAASAAAGKQ